MWNLIGKMYFVRELMEDKRHEEAETTTWTGSSWFYFTDKYCRWEKQANLSFTSIRTTENCDVNRCKLRNYKFDISLVSIFRLIQHCDPSCSVQSHRFPFYRWTTVSLSTKITFVQTPIDCKKYWTYQKPKEEAKRVKLPGNIAWE